MTAEIRLTGRAGSQRMRGTLVAGFEQPASLRLEAVAPFGPPVFIMVAKDRAATLWLERVGRVVANVAAADVLDALTGVRLDAGGLRAILAGCVVPAPEPANGRSFPNGWTAVDVGLGAVVYLKREQGQWRIVAGQVPGFEVGYAAFQGGRPTSITLQSTSEDDGTPVVNLALALSQVTTNTTLKPGAFELAVPASAKPMSVDELRGEGPLGEARKKAQDEKRKKDKEN
jgi:hypothetical protein